MWEKISDGLGVYSRGTAEAKGMSITAGLWGGCTKPSDGSDIKKCAASVLTCSGIPKEILGQCLKLMMARTFTIMACMFSVSGTLLLLIIGITRKINSRLIIFGKMLAIASFISGVIGVSVGGAWALSGFGKLGVAAILAIVATALNLVSAVIALVVRKQQT